MFKLSRKWILGINFVFIVVLTTLIVESAPNMGQIEWLKTTLPWLHGYFESIKNALPNVFAGALIAYLMIPVSGSTLFREHDNLLAIKLYSENILKVISKRELIVLLVVSRIIHRNVMAVMLLISMVSQHIIPMYLFLIQFAFLTQSIILFSELSTPFAGDSESAAPDSRKHLKISIELEQGRLIAVLRERVQECVDRLNSKIDKMDLTTLVQYAKSNSFQKEMLNDLSVIISDILNDKFGRDIASEVKKQIAEEVFFYKKDKSLRMDIYRGMLSGDDTQRYNAKSLKMRIIAMYSSPRVLPNQSLLSDVSQKIHVKLFTAFLTIESIKNYCRMDFLKKAIEDSRNSCGTTIIMENTSKLVKSHGYTESDYNRTLLSIIALFLVHPSLVVDDDNINRVFAEIEKWRHIRDSDSPSHPESEKCYFIRHLAQVEVSQWNHSTPQPDQNLDQP